MFFAKIRSLFRYFITRDHDSLLLFPYISQQKLTDQNCDQLCNNARKYSLQHYNNQVIHHGSRHEKLADFYQQNQPVHWIGIVSDIMDLGKASPKLCLLIDKLTLDDPRNPRLLDYHVWIKVDQIKYIMNPSGQQTIAIGDAIRGISLVHTYYGKNGETKYGFVSTVLKGAGILSGNTKRSKWQTDLNATLIYNYNRFNDWILKCVNSPDIISTNNVNRLLREKEHVTYIERDNQDIRFYQRTTNHSQALHSLKTYTGILRLPTYIYGKNNRCEAVIAISDIRVTPESQAIKKSFFQFKGAVLKLGQLSENKKVRFSTRSNLPTSVHRPGVIEDCQLIDALPGPLLPKGHDELLGYIMEIKHDHQPEHTHYRQKFDQWQATQGNNLAQIGNLISEHEIARALKIKNSTLERKLQTLLITPKYTYNGEKFYNFSVVDQIQNDLRLTRLWYGTKKPIQHRKRKKWIISPKSA